MTTDALAGRVARFCETYDLSVPILMAPMAGACPAALASAVARAGGMGACGALKMSPDAILSWAAEVRTGSNGAFQLNTWIPEAAPARNPVQEEAVRMFLEQWGPDVPPEAADTQRVDFEAQCAAMLEAGPAVISSIMGVYPPEFVAEMKAARIRWFATVTTVAEAVAAEAAGADVIVAQGMEAGGHRGAFAAEQAASRLVGLFSLVPAVVDAVRVPVVATGGIADARGVAAALMLGASAVQIGTGLLRTEEAGLAQSWSDGIGAARPEDTTTTRAFSGRLGRSLRTGLTEAFAAPDTPDPAPFPVQGGLAGPMRADAARSGELDGMSAWAGQSAALSRSGAAGDVVQGLWAEAQALLGM